MNEIDGAFRCALPNGYFRMPPGKLANAVTYLEMRAPFPTVGRQASPEGCSLQALTGADAARFAALYRRVGDPWLWAGHLDKPTAQLADYLGDPARTTLALVGPPGDIGLLELQFAGTASAEIVYFGLVPDAVGMGLGTWLMQEAIGLAQARAVQRLWVHTCNFDHPSAVRFYQGMGFKIYAVGFEIMDDPRVTGLLPREAAPHVPLVDGPL